MKEVRADDEIRCTFAAFALQGLLTGAEHEFLDDYEVKKFIAETAFELADMMMGVRNATTRH